MTNNPLKCILILAANPNKTGQLRLDEEVREIDKALRRAQKREQFQLRQRWAVTPRELQRAVLEEMPHIVHFCGHGTGEDGLVLEDETGQVNLVSTAALAGLFQLFADQVECVLLNACYSEVQAEVISQHINYVIGMNQPIGDHAAIEFAVGFYDGLGAGRSYDFAYDFGCNSIRFAGIAQDDIPVLKRRSPRSNIPSLWIHGWVKQSYGGSPTVELDWTQYFRRESRQIPDLAVWEETLFPNLAQAKKTITNTHRPEYIDLRGKLPLTAILAVGATFPEVGGYQFQAEQITRGEVNLWRSHMAPSPLKFKVVEEKGKAGKDLLIAFSITGPAWGDVVKLIHKSPGLFNALVYAEPETGVGDAAISSNADVTALAIHAKELIRQNRQKYRASCIHLILYAPAAFCLFLGQRLNALGEVVGYERTVDGNYQAAVRLQTG